MDSLYIFGMLPHLKNLITSLECYPVFRMLLDVWNRQAKISTPEYNVNDEKANLRLLISSYLSSKGQNRIY